MLGVRGQSTDVDRSLIGRSFRLLFKIIKFLYSKQRNQSTIQESNMILSFYAGRNEVLLSNCYPFWCWWNNLETSSDNPPLPSPES